MSLVFWPEFPYIKWENPPEQPQTVEEAQAAVQAAYRRKINRMARNIQNQQNGGFTWTEPKPKQNETTQKTSGETLEVRDEVVQNSN